MSTRAQDQEDLKDRTGMCQIGNPLLSHCIAAWVTDSLVPTAEGGLWILCSSVKRHNGRARHAGPGKGAGHNLVGTPP